MGRRRKQSKGGQEPPTSPGHGSQQGSPDQSEEEETRQSSRVNTNKKQRRSLPRTARPIFSSLNPAEVFGTDDLRSAPERQPTSLRAIRGVQRTTRKRYTEGNTGTRKTTLQGTNGVVPGIQQNHPGTKRRGRPKKTVQETTVARHSTPIASQSTSALQDTQTMPSAIETSSSTPQRVHFMQMQVPTNNQRRSRDDIWDYRLQQNLNDSTIVHPSNSPQEEEEEIDQETEEQESSGEEEEANSSGDDTQLSGSNRTALKRENKYLLQEYRNLKQIYLQQKELGGTIGQANPQDKSQYFSVAVRIGKDLTSTFQRFEDNCRWLQSPIDPLIRSTHYKMMDEIEHWTKQGTSLNTSNLALSQLEQTTSLIPSGTDRGQIQVYVGTETQEISDVSMPKGFFDPKVTEPAQLEVVRKTISTIKLPEFDGTTKTGSWESWWKLFRERVHQFPDYLIPESTKLSLLTAAIKGKPRELLRLDKPSTLTNESAYTKIVRQLHQLYGKRTYTADEVSLQIHKLELKNFRDQDSCIIFLNELDDLTIQFIQSGEPLTSAYDTAIRRMLNNISDFHRREVLRAHQGIHTITTPSQKRFFDYKDWLIEFMSQNKGQRGNRQNTEEKNVKHKKFHREEYKKKSEKDKKHKFSKKEDKYKRKEGSSKRDPKGFKRAFLAVCQLHHKPAHHSPLDCKLPWEEKLKVCKEKKLCCICQETGHLANKCPNRKAVNHIKYKQQKKNNKEAEKIKAEGHIPQIKSEVIVPAPQLPQKPPD